MDLNKALQNISNELDADIYIFNALIENSTADKFITEVKKQENKRKNIYLILTTFGGDPDAAYRIVRFIKNNYEKFYLLILGYCKSAGTLIALGADEIIFSDFGELGPLDIQLSKEDELIPTSGLTLRQALMMLQQMAFDMFEDYFLSLKRKSGGNITTKTAAEISSSLVIGLLSPILAQIDPMRMGEIERAMKIALEYGNRICDNEDLVLELVTSYVSHGFVIDYNEAKEKFKNVRKLNDNETVLEKGLFEIMRQASDKSIITKLHLEEDNNLEEKINKGEQNEKSTDGASEKQATGADGKNKRKAKKGSQANIN